MAKSARNKSIRNEFYGAKGQTSSRLRRRKYALTRRFNLTEHLLGGSLNLVHLKCGQSTFHCASNEGHPMWTLTYSVEGKRRVEFIPDKLVECIQPLVNEGKSFRNAVYELMNINAQLLTLYRKQTSKRTK